MSVWYYVQEGRRQGPVSVGFVVDELRRGRLTLADRAWTEGMEAWTPISELPEILEAQRNAPPPLPEAPLVPPVAAAAEPALPGVSYAPVSLRAAAMLIDVAINSIPLGILLYIIVAATNVSFETVNLPDSEEAAKVRLIFQICAMPWLWLYNAGFEASSLQATPGKLAMGLRVCSLAGERLGFGRATWRFFWKNMTMVFGFVLALDFPLLGYRSPRKQTLHDIFAQSVVVLKQPALEKKGWTSA